MLAIMVGTALAALVPAALASQDTTKTSPLRDVLRVGFLVGDVDKPGPGTMQGLPPDQAATLLSAVAAIPGTTLVPLYHPAPADNQPPAIGVDGPYGGGQDVVRCADARRLPVLGTCPAGAAGGPDRRQRDVHRQPAGAQRVPAVHHLEQPGRHCRRQSAVGQ